jgi:hypothetical protein
MDTMSDAQRLDQLCAKYGLPLEHLWAVRDQPIVRMLSPVNDTAMQERFDAAGPVLELVRNWDSTREAGGGVPPELDEALADRERRLDLERLTVLIRRRNDSQRR